MITIARILFCVVDVENEEKVISEITNKKITKKINKNSLQI